MNENDCMLKEITSFLIRVGEHCMKCEGKTVELSKPVKEPTPRIEIPIKTIAPQKHKARNIKISYLEKWIKQIGFDVFTLDQFFKAYPLQKENKHLARNISRLIADKKILQLGKNKFKVVI